MLTKKNIHLSIIMALFVLLLCSFDTFAEDLSREEVKLQQIKNELFHQKRKLKITKAKEREALQELYIIQKELKTAQERISGANSKISNNKDRIKTLNNDLGKYNENIGSKNEKLKFRIKEIFKSGSGSNLFEVIFGAASMSDFLNRAYYFGRVIRGDVLLIKSIRDEIYNINEARLELQASNQEISGLVRRISDHKIYIRQRKTKQQRTYEILRSRRMDYEKRVAELEESSREFEKLIRRVVADRTSRGVYVRGTGRFAMPIEGRIVSKFGYRRHPLWGGYHMHTGIDIASPYGRPIRASDDGEVIYSGWWDGYGKAVVIDHGRGYTTVYGHLSRIHISAGQRVEQGQFIGLVGSTGFSTGPHLHFEIRQDGKPINPLNYI